MRASHALLALSSIFPQPILAAPPGNAAQVVLATTKNSSPAHLFRRVDNSCGLQNGNRVCNGSDEGGGYCCSSDGWCGNSEKYCGKGCQENFGKCDAKQDDKPPRVAECGERNKRQSCSTGECCSKDGICGTGDRFCLAGCQGLYGTCGQYLCGSNNGNKICPDGQCCSRKFGTCGTGMNFCEVPGTCWPEYGMCDSDFTPGGYNVSADSRTAKGTIPYGKVVDRCTVSGSLALTYDDGPSANTERLLDILQEADARATFFISGNSISKGPIDSTPEWTRLIRRMVEDGHQVASHSWGHLDLATSNHFDRQADLLRNERALANILGKYPTYMRPPYFECSTLNNCLGDMQDLGYHVIGYSQDSTDWNYPKNLTEMKKSVDAAFAKTPVTAHMLMIQHDTLELSAINLTMHILDSARQYNFTPVTVGQCLEDDAANWYREPAWITPWSTSRDGCTTSDRYFCSNIRRFSNQEECFDSNSQCEEDVLECQANTSVNQTTCARLEGYCSMQFMYCSTCSDLDKPCDIDHWQFQSRNA